MHGTQFLALVSARPGRTVAWPEYTKTAAELEGLAQVWGDCTCAHTPARLCATSVTLVRLFARMTCRTQNAAM